MFNVQVDFSQRRDTTLKKFFIDLLLLLLSKS